MNHSRRTKLARFLKLIVCLWMAMPLLTAQAVTEFTRHPELDMPEMMRIAGFEFRRVDDEDGRRLIIRRAGKTLLTLRSRWFNLNYLPWETNAGPLPWLKELGPSVILSDHSGGAHCCTTIHLMWLGSEFRHQAIDVSDSDAWKLSEDDPPKVQFSDFAFAYWRTAFAFSPAPTVILHFDASTKRYAPDIEAMRRPPPDSSALAVMAKEIQKAEAELPKEDEPPAPLLWGKMLDLIYSSNAPAARRVLDVAWPPELPGKDRFLTCFTDQLTNGEFWKAEKLGRLLHADADFPATTPAEHVACKD